MSTVSTLLYGVWLEMLGMSLAVWDRTVITRCETTQVACENRPHHFIFVYRAMMMMMTYGFRRVDKRIMPCYSVLSVEPSSLSSVV